MVIKLLEQLTTHDSVVFPKGYEFACDSLLNLANGFTELAQVDEVSPGFFLNRPPILTVSPKDVPKLAVILDGAPPPPKSSDWQGA